MPIEDAQRYVALAPHAVLRRLEAPFLYDLASDDLYELNQEALEGLLRCRGDLTLAAADLEEEFAAFCLEEGLLTLHDAPRPRPLAAPRSPTPSLRYLELQVTWRCNLSCRHCYLGPARGVDLSLERVAALVREFAAMGGLRIMVSGGEPLMHPRWDEINACLAALPLRRVLLSNGLLLEGSRLEELQCDEVQISLDGLAAGHEGLRGRGSFERAVAAARRVVASGRELSIATMVHPGNLVEMEGLADLVAELGAREWGIDAPCLDPGSPLAVTPAQAARALEYAYGGAFHGSGGGMACGLHLGTVAADGAVAQCGFYLDQPLGQAREGLWTCWARRRPLALAAIQGCADCDQGEDCAGGCRYRAPAPDQPDPVMCALRGVTPDLA